MPINCFISGGTGVLGRRVVPLLVRAGHTVVVLSRNSRRDRMIREMGATPVRADLFHVESLRAAIAGHEAVINIATHIPPLHRAARTGAWAENERIRTEGVANLIQVARGNQVTRFVQESIVFPYDGHGNEWIDETSRRTQNAITESSLTAERSATEFTADGSHGVILRFAQFYALDSSHTISHAKRRDGESTRSSDHLATTFPWWESRRQPVR